MRKRLLLKIAFLLFVFSLPLIGLTNALFIDTETSSANAFSAASLDFSLTSGGDFSPPSLNPGDSATRGISLIDDGSLPFQYNLQAVKTGGDDGFCNALTLVAKLEEVIKYNGSLLGLNLAPPVVISGNQDNWEFVVSLNDNDPNLQNKVCEFNFVFRGWQTDSDGSWGFIDEEIMGNIIESGDWTPPVITLVTFGTPGEQNGMTVTWRTDENATSNIEWGTTKSYGNAAPTTEDTSANKTSHSVEITGLRRWKAYHFRVKSKDAAGNEAVSGDHRFRLKQHFPEILPRGDIVINEFLPNPVGADDAPMPAGEWVELYNKGDGDANVAGWRLCDWSFPACRRAVVITSSNTNTGDTVVPSKGFLVVYLNGEYSPGWLTNWFDIVCLFDASMDLIDARAYGAAQKGKSFARYPDGSRNWYDPIPTPGEPNRLESGVEDTQDETAPEDEEVTENEQT